MIRNLSFDNIKELEYNVPHMKVKKNKVLLENGALEIPSSLYPLTSSKIDIFYYNNTKGLEDTEDFKLLLECYNEVECKIGRCYTNITEFLKVAKNKGLKGKLKPYVGWLMIGNVLNLVHHCWAVYENKYVLDFGGSKLDFETIQEMSKRDKSMDEIREKLVEVHMANVGRPNSEVYTIGQVIPSYIYIGCECEPVKGVDTFIELMDRYPNHPNYTNVDNGGASKLQRMIIDKQKQ